MTISPRTHSLKQLKEMIIRIALTSLKRSEGIHRIAHDLHHIIKFPLIRYKSVTSGAALQYWMKSEHWLVLNMMNA